MMTNGLMAAAAVAVAVVTPNMAHAGDSWYLLYVPKNFSEAIYVDTTSMTTSGTTKSVVMQTVERVSVEPGNIFATSILLETDCASHDQKMLKATVFNDLDKAEDRPIPSAAAAPPQPGSLGELVAKFVCSKTDSWDKTQLVDEGSVGGSIRQYGRFMLQTRLVDAFNTNPSIPK